MYIITDYEKAKNGSGYGPALPDLDEQGGCSQLCGSGRHFQFALYDVSGINEEQIAPPMEHVGGELGRLLRAAEKYPPAMAKARSVLEGRTEPITRGEFRETSRRNYSPGWTISGTVGTS